MTKKLSEIIDVLYNLNAEISLHKIGLKEPVTQKNIEAINEILGKAICELRDIDNMGDCGDGGCKEPQATASLLRSEVNRQSVEAKEIQDITTKEDSLSSLNVAPAVSQKPNIVIIDDNPISLAKYCEEHPDVAEEMFKALEKNNEAPVEARKVKYPLKINIDLSEFEDSDESEVPAEIFVLERSNEGLLKIQRQEGLGGYYEARFRQSNGRGVDFSEFIKSLKEGDKIEIKRVRI